MAARQSGIGSEGISNIRDTLQHTRPAQLAAQSPLPDGGDDWWEYCRIGVYSLVFTMLSTIAYHFIFSVCLPEKAALIIWLVLLSLGLPLRRLRQSLVPVFEVVLLLLGGH